MNCCHAAVVNVHRTWQNITVEKKQQGNCVSLKGIDERGLWRSQWWIHPLNPLAVVKTLSIEMNRKLSQERTNDRSVNVSLHPSPQHRNGICTYVNECESTEEATICTTVSTLGIQLLPSLMNIIFDHLTGIQWCMRRETS